MDQLPVESPDPDPLLPSKDELCAVELARGKTRAQAAEASGLSERTVYARLRDPVFVARVVELRHAFVDEAVAKLSSAAGQAADTLLELLNRAQPPTVRLGAARAILSDLIGLELHAELEGRIAELERVAGRSGSESGR